jgi:protein-S-isoprenylcysteine O-methyltransferase Ste14
MKINWYGKIFGVGPLGAIYSLSLLWIFFWIGRKVGNPQLFANHALMRIAGVAIAVMGLGLHLWTFKTLGNWWMKNQLCTRGPFKYFRHPMYAAWITFIALGTSLFLNAWIYLVWYVSLQPIWHRLVVREELIMADLFGNDYQTYAACTGRFFPIKIYKPKNRATTTQ